MSARSKAVVMVIAAAICLPATACKKAGQDAASPGATHMNRESDPLAELEQLERKMDRLGLSIASETRGVSDAGEGAAVDATFAGEVEADDEMQPAEEAMETAPVAAEPPDGVQMRRNQCQDVCELSVAICDLEVRICSLSESHGGDPTYANACRRAGDDCEVADHECDRCAN